MKRLTKRLLIEVNHEAETLMPYYLKPDHTKVSRLVGPNYVYFTNGMVLKVFFEGIGIKYDGKYSAGLMLPMIGQIDVKILRNILKDLKSIKALHTSSNIWR